MQVRRSSSADAQEGKLLYLALYLLGAYSEYSGKSTLLLTLLRVLELQSGKIELDGIDISRVRLDLLRQRCFITVSQDALLLSNETLRFNLDPNASLPEDIIIDALARTGLWQHFCKRETRKTNGCSEAEADSAYITTFGEHLILDKKMTMFRELSVGQCQLFALCRALIRVSTLRSAGAKPIVLLDEVTSSLDSATESTIQSIIDMEFTDKGHTVIIVTHRLGVLAERSIPGRDMVALMKDGRLQEVITDLRPSTLRNLVEKR